MTTDTIRTRRNRWRLAMWGAAAALLAVPAIAMRFTQEVNWTPADFVFAGVLIFGTLGAYQFVTRSGPSAAYRLACGLSLLAAFLMTWANMAVGIIGNEDNPANLLFFGVLAIGLAGALIARFRPAGMAATLVAMALAQTAIGAWASSQEVVILPFTVVFAAIWLTAAALFRRAARQATRS